MRGLALVTGNPMKHTPTSRQSFKLLIEGGFVYVDKTGYLLDMINLGAGGAFFLSRPRRFGKSLFLDTVATLFGGIPPTYQANVPGKATQTVSRAKVMPAIPDRLWKPLEPNVIKTLFSGTKIGDPKEGYDFEQIHPVIYLDMQLDGTTSNDLGSELLLTLRARAAAEGKDFLTAIDSPRIRPGTLLKNLVEGLADKYGAGTVLLVDEYDSPVSDNLDSPRLAEANQKTLKLFYGSLKRAHASLHLSLVTGITRYSFTGLSSGLNHLRDLTLDQQFAGICGFSEKELNDSFEDHMKRILPGLRETGVLPRGSGLSKLRELILKCYDGYSWDGRTRVLNPWSILGLLDTGQFAGHWRDTWPSTAILRKIASSDPFLLLKDRVSNIKRSDIRRAELNSPNPAAALFQTGYLTVESLSFKNPVNPTYSLKVPNQEIASGRSETFSKTLFSILKRDPVREADAFLTAVKALDSDRLTELFNSFFGALPARHHETDESCYHKLAYGYCFGMGFMPDPEVLEAVGIPDLRLKLEDGADGSLWAVIELKYGESEAANPSAAVMNRLVARKAKEALKDSTDKNYGISIKSRADKLVRIGLGVTTRGLCKAVMAKVKG
jgi:hypothetical protein